MALPCRGNFNCSKNINLYFQPDDNHILNVPCQASIEEGQSGGKLAAILLPVVLVVLIIGVVTAWQLRREYNLKQTKSKKGSLQDFNL